jgi:hypothetical protein
VRRRGLAVGEPVERGVEVVDLEQSSDVRPPDPRLAGGA